jgi:hypothetical protein
MNRRARWTTGLVLVAVIVLGLGAVIAWPRSQTRFCQDTTAAEAFRDALRAADGDEPLPLDDMVPFEWDTLWQFSAYDPVDEIERMTRLDVGPDSALREWCAYRSVVFAHRGEVVAVYSYPEGEPLAWMRRSVEPYGPDAYVTRTTDGLMVCDSAGCPERT